MAIGQLCQVTFAARLENHFRSTDPALNRALRDGGGKSDNSVPKTWEDVNNFYLNNSSLAHVDAQRTSANIMLYQMTNDVFKCGNQAADPNAYFSCTQMLSDQQQAFAVDAAAGGSGMTRTMITSMGFLLALFIGLSPLVLLVALASGSNALPLLGKYLMFGAWTQSWLPAAFLINFFIIHTWTKAMLDMVQRFDYSIPLEAVPLFWMETSDKIAVASDRPASDIPEAPKEVRVDASPETIAGWVKAADEMATAGAVGMGRYVVEGASAPAAGIAEQYFDQIGKPFAEAVRNGGVEGGRPSFMTT